MLQNWSVARSVRPGPNFSQGRLRAEKPLSYLQVTLTGNELCYSNPEITNTSLNDSCGTINTVQNLFV
jgi:hypothetical protein